MASPHVTGLVGYLYGVDPSLSRDQVIGIVTSLDNRFPVADGAAASIDAYLAVLDIDRVKGDDRVRRKLLDVSIDDRFDEVDLEQFRSAFEQFDPADAGCRVPSADGSDCPIYSRYNLNGYGVAGSDIEKPFDLDRDGAYGTVTPQSPGTTSNLFNVAFPTPTLGWATSSNAIYTYR